MQKSKKEIEKTVQPKTQRPGKPESIRLHYGESLKQYRNTLRKKKEQHVRNQLKVIEESIDSNHFWEHLKKLNKQQHEELSIQIGDVWVNHFSNLFGSAKTYT